MMFLNWPLEGATRWQKEGLVVPIAILNTTNEYRGEMDVIGNFLKDCCIVREGATIWAMNKPEPPKHAFGRDWVLLAHK